MGNILLTEYLWQENSSVNTESKVSKKKNNNNK